MTPLEDRLDRIEQQIEEVLRMMRVLIEMQRDHGAGRDQAIPPREDWDAEMRRIMTELGMEQAGEVWAQDDPVEQQYHLARQWAAQGRTEDLSEFDLSGRNLRNIDLKDARLSRANLTRADLTAGKLARAELTAASLSRAQLARADLTRTVLTECDLSFANLSYAKLEGASLRHAKLMRANLLGANLSGAELDGADLSRCNLARATLKEASVSGRQLAMASSLEGATMPDGRLFDKNTEPYVKR